MKALEYPPPVLALSVQELVIEAKGEHSLSFSVRNTRRGAHTLAGQIVSPSACLRFEPERWEGDQQEIKCCFSPQPEEGWKPGDVRTFDVQFLSNGGEFVLPVTVRLSKMAIKTEQAVTIANLHDFEAYVGEFPAEAQELFADDEFHMLLLAMDFPYIEAYQLLAKEAKRARALDNFLILAGLKKRTGLQVLQKEVEHRAFEDAMLYGHFSLQKSDGGYIEAELLSDANWLSLAKDSISTKDFSRENILVVKYSIDPLLINGRYARERVVINSPDMPAEAAVDIIFKRPSPISAWLPREGYRFKDEGLVVVENHSDEALVVDIHCNEPFVRFFERRYKLMPSGYDGGASGELQIPFVIKLPPLQSAQMLFRKVPSLTANIEITASYRGDVIRKSLALTAGEW